MKFLMVRDGDCWWCILILPTMIQTNCSSMDEVLLMNHNLVHLMMVCVPVINGSACFPPISLNRLCWRGIPLGACCFLFQICSLFLKNLNGPWSPYSLKVVPFHSSHAWWMPPSSNSGASPLSKNFYVPLLSFFLFAFSFKIFRNQT